ncbi:MAG: RluA family pseudouridine synthase [Pedosphaera sp.]|nr:RluA family pseudouridine synthase [Pedosphaera sp.]
MAKLDHIELRGDRSVTRIPIVYEDRSVMAIDKPAWWMLVPFDWQRTDRNLAAAIASSLEARDFWARSRNLKFLRNVHRLDAETTGILLLAKSAGGVNTFGDLFESRRMEKTYLAVVRGEPKRSEWTIRLNLAPDPDCIGRMKVDDSMGKEAETSFRVVESRAGHTLVEAHPFTGRTHQIRLHLQASGHPIVGDPMYGSAPGLAPKSAKGVLEYPMALRAVGLNYIDPFTRRETRIRAPVERFLKAFGFELTI